MTQDEADFVVVGGGAAGAVVARRLADDGRFTVALVEAGPSDEGEAAVLDLRRYQEVVDGPLAVKLPVRPQANADSRVVHPVARVLGGCTSQNTCIWFAPPAPDLARWERLGATGWGVEGTARARALLEERLRFEVLPIETSSQRALFDACRAAGYAAVDFARPFGEGVGRYRLNKIGNRRQSASVAYLHPLAGVPRTLAVRTRMPAERLVVEPDGRIGVVFAGGRVLRANREVILCAGAFGSPKLLMLSGIGPADHLRALGIAVARDLPGVGAHLLDHPDCSINWRAVRPTEPAEPWRYGCVLFAAIDAAAQWPDIEIQLCASTVEKQTRAAGYPSAADGFAAYLTVNRARSEGSVRLASPLPQDEPLVDSCYFTDPGGYDMRIMVAGLRLARRVFAQSPLVDWLDEEVAPGAAAQDDAALAEFVRRTHSTGYHPAGTCRMGRAEDPMAVVGPDLAVRGVRGVRVADASIFPAMVSVNIAATCMMIGEKAAELILADATR